MKTAITKKYAMVALSVMGSAILLFSCGKAKSDSDSANNETLMTERSEHLTILMSENGRRSYHFKTPLLEGYTMASDPYREFRKGIRITTYQDDSLTTVNATLVANYAIFYEERELWEAKGDVVVEKADGTKLYTQQLYWNSKTGRIYSNVDSKIVKGTDTFMGEGFESDEELKEWRFRRMSGRMFVNMEPTEPSDSTEVASVNLAEPTSGGALANETTESAEKQARSTPNSAVTSTQSVKSERAEKHRVETRQELPATDNERPSVHKLKERQSTISEEKQHRTLPKNSGRRVKNEGVKMQMQMQQADEALRVDE